MYLLEPFIRLRGPAVAEQFAVAHKGKTFDPDVVKAFQTIVRLPDVEQVLKKEDLWDVVLDMEPDSPYRSMPEKSLDEIALAFADSLDLKSPVTLFHSRETARLAGLIAGRLGLPPQQSTNIRRAALVHDLGQLAVPSAILMKTAPLNEAERERLQLHPYYTERILSRVSAMREIAIMAGAHHERLDGGGYFRGLSGNQISIGARILAVADEFDECSRLKPAHPNLEPQEALRAMQSEKGTLLDPACMDALAQELGVGARTKRVHRQFPAGLTEREVEVLGWLAKGASNHQIAEALVISEKTAGHHLEHKYNKIGISSRAAAVFFAVENELIE
jgi:HD-GYP domain-containing protein (c-di-GMP phosphodiesterase class II)